MSEKYYRDSIPNWEGNIWTIGEEKTRDGFDVQHQPGIKGESKFPMIHSWSSCRNRLRNSKILSMDGLTMMTTKIWNMKTPLSLKYAISQSESDHILGFKRKMPDESNHHLNPPVKRAKVRRFKRIMPIIGKFEQDSKLMERNKSSGKVTISLQRKRHVWR
ncbi:hypothetical protein LIER_07960 [Lithospermum erythrorhizon]|uniref:Uncharacterized protein n=1 Tax=Lithospermum erythrorhizon TaxID=34254 RepID=A0AAV3PCX3_LITER